MRIETTLVTLGSVFGMCAMVAYYRYWQTSNDGAYGQGLFHYGQFLAYAFGVMLVAIALASHWLV
jgi:hypothetical protein